MSKLLGEISEFFLNGFADNMLYRITKDKYTDNLMVAAPIISKLSLIPGLELMMRAVQGEPLERPLGSYRRMSPWEQLMLNPVHLHRLPTPDPKTMDTAVTIGPRAERPLQLKIPIAISGMSYGTALAKKVKIALAKAANLVGTATNTGEAGLMKEERETALKLIGQYNRGGYLNTPEKYMQLDAIEIQLGQGAQGAAPQRFEARFIDEEMREVFELEKGQDALLHSRVPDMQNYEQFQKRIKELREETEVPVGVKFSGTHFLEKEIELAVEAGVDFIVVDGAEGGTHAAAPTLEDDLGLPTIYCISRAHRHLQRLGVRSNITLIAAGGLLHPGQFLKALALGADVVYIATAALVAMVAPQFEKVLPWEPPMQMILHANKLNHKFNIEKAVKGLNNYLQLSLQEMVFVLYTLGKKSTRELSADDLCCLDPNLARTLGIQYAGVSPEEQSSFFNGYPF